MQVTALAAGRLDETAERDTLFVGSLSNLLAYDVENNSDIYYKVRERITVSIVKYVPHCPRRCMIPPPPHAR